MIDWEHCMAIGMCGAVSLAGMLTGNPDGAYALAGGLIGYVFARYKNGIQKAK